MERTMEILVIDRNRRVCQLVGEYLTLNDYKVVTRDWINLENFPFCYRLIIVDVSTFNNDFIRWIKISRKVPIIIMIFDPASLVVCLQNKLPTITKPFKFEALQNLVEEVLDSDQRMEGKYMNEKTTDYITIVERVKNEDIESFQVLFKLFYPTVYRTVYFITQNKVLAEDATQETFIKVYKYIKQLRDNEKFKAWLYTIASQEAKEILSRNKRLIPIENLDKAVMRNKSNCDSVIDEWVTKYSLQTELFKAMKQLDLEFKQVVVLRYYCDLTQQEISDNLKVNLGTVKSRLHRAMKKLRNSVTIGFTEEVAAGEQ